MAQHDYVIDNQTAPNFRADLNNALAAIVSTNSGSSAPSTTYANMLWYDTTNNILKMRNEADDTWINVGYLDQTAGAFRILDDTQVVNTSGTQTGLLGDQSTATWEGGTGTTESLVSPAKVKAAIDTLTPMLFNASGSAPVYACRAWVNFNGTGTVAIRASGNVTSIMDLGVGHYRVNFTTAMPDVNYAVTGQASNSRNTYGGGAQFATTLGVVGTPSVDYVDVGVMYTYDPSARDAQDVSVAIFR